jgi:PleD family two-component response regulator
MKKALVVDDNRQMAESLQKMLKMLGIEVEIAFGSRAALLSLHDYDKPTPDMVFLDINMPGIDGLEVLGFMKREPIWADVPVFIVSSDDQPETIARAKANGVKGYIVKPADFDRLEAALKEENLL